MPRLTDAGLACLFLAALASPAHAQPAAPDRASLSVSAARLEARRLLEQASQATDHRSMLQYVESAYRLYPAPLILYNLGQVWYQQSRFIEAADLFRRYLHEA